MSQEPEHSHIPDECYQQRIQELAESCDYEYYMSALPSESNKERATRGRNRILQAIEALKKLQQAIKCVACREEIQRQIALQEKGIIEIEQAWSS